jgi:hypothetical protein
MFSVAHTVVAGSAVAVYIAEQFTFAAITAGISHRKRPTAPQRLGPRDYQRRFALVFVSEAARRTGIR